VTGACTNPKIADLDLDAPSVEANGMSTSILAPICILHKSTVGALASSGEKEPGLWLAKFEGRAFDEHACYNAGRRPGNAGQAMQVGGQAAMQAGDHECPF